MMALTGALALALTPLPASAADDGMSVLQTVGIFVLVPFAIWAVIWFLWMIPKWRRDPGLSTGQAWNPRP